MFVDHLQKPQVKKNKNKKFFSKNKEEYNIFAQKGSYNCLARKKVNKLLLGLCEQAFCP